MLLPHQESEIPQRSPKPWARDRLASGRQIVRSNLLLVRGQDTGEEQDKGQGMKDGKRMDGRKAERCVSKIKVKEL